ncbi:ComF family protein [Lactiplantibacillus carotarum]|uniref:ComF family protein n=1 Tax=Lactiplantibacillus carotarum TaxID=2993456 RepID=UPI00298F145F|nr:phosphoribosyltransferase family protein [Lactiplantibacillus carotarum]
MKCLLCHQTISTKLTLPWILSWQPIARPVVCQRCWATFAPIQRATACPGCGRSQSRPQLCADCQRWPLNQAFKNIALFDYNDAMHAYFQRYKFQGDYQLRRVFQIPLQRTVTRLAGDLVLSIPVTPATMTTRGFNQVTGWLTDGENQPGIMTKAKIKAKAQSQKDRSARLATPQPFQLVTTQVQVQDRHVVLVDDIYTTGRTIRHAAQLILESGAKSVTGLTLAR